MSKSGPFEQDSLTFEQLKLFMQLFSRVKSQEWGPSDVFDYFKKDRELYKKFTAYLQCVEATEKPEKMETGENNDDPSETGYRVRSL